MHADSTPIYRCPNPPRLHLQREGLDGRQEIVELTCNRSQCKFCAPVKAMQTKWEAARRIASDRAIAPDLVTLAVTLTLRDMKVLTNEGFRQRSFSLLKVATKAIDTLRRKSGCAISYLSVLHAHKSGVGHLHMLLLIVPQAGREVPETKKLKSWLWESWNQRVGVKLGFPRTRTYTPANQVGQVYIEPVEDTDRYLEYILLGGENGDPWVIPWKLPVRSHRIRSSRGFLMKPKRPEQEHATEGEAFAPVKGSARDYVARLRREGIVVEDTSPDRFRASIPSKASRVRRIANPVHVQQLGENDSNSDD